VGTKRNKMKKETMHEGWECVPQLVEVADNIRDIGHHLYEIRDCCRQQSTEDIVLELRNTFKSAIALLDEIDTDIDYETIYD
jgi:hypothetical protein